VKTAPLDLVLVNPGSRMRLYQALGKRLTAVENPVWAGLIATFIRQRGFSVEIVDVGHLSGYWTSALVFACAARAAVHAGDMQALSEGLVRIIAMLASAQVAPHIGKPFVVRVGDRIRKWNAHTKKNAIQAQLFAGVLDALPMSVADHLVARMTGEAIDLAALARDKEALLQFVNREVSGVYHPTGTCRMGLPNDPSAVVDPDGRVIGMEGLRVADASVMPTIPRGNTNIPTIMVAEKLSDHILQDRVSV